MARGQEILRAAASHRSRSERVIRFVRTLAKNWVLDRGMRGALLSLSVSFLLGATAVVLGFGTWRRLR